MRSYHHRYLIVMLRYLRCRRFFEGFCVLEMIVCYVGHLPSRCYPSCPRVVDVPQNRSDPDHCHSAIVGFHVFPLPLFHFCCCVLIGVRRLLLHSLHYCLGKNCPRSVIDSSSKNILHSETLNNWNLN